MSSSPLTDTLPGCIRIGERVIPILVKCNADIVAKFDYSASGVVMDSRALIDSATVDHRPVVAWLGPDGQLMLHDVYVAWVEVRNPPDADKWSALVLRDS